jgi:hypothetical protein
VYNAGLAERRDAWRSAGVKVSLFERFGQLTELRGVRDDVFVWGVQPLRARCGAWMRPTARSCGAALPGRRRGCRGFGPAAGCRKIPVEGAAAGVFFLRSGLGFPALGVLSGA